MEHTPTQSIQRPTARQDDPDNKHAQIGKWDPAVINLLNVPVHSHLLPNGKILYWGRRVDLDGDLHPHECTPLVWDPGKPDEKPKATPQPRRGMPGNEHGETVNLFCSGHAFLPDGRLLVAGGHDGADGSGLNQACIYDYRSNTWEHLPPMNNGRWYPAATTLADGTVLVSSGSYAKPPPNGPASINVVPQIWDDKEKAWKTVDVTDVFPLFPTMHVAPDGRVFMSGSRKETFLLDTGKTGEDAWEECGPRESGLRDYAPAVMYEPGKVIYIGGGLDPDNGKPTNITEIIDLNQGTPKWKLAGRMNYHRRQHNATILADGTVLVTGGTQGGGKGWQEGFNDIRPGAPVHTAELWDPHTGTWTELAAETVDRCYHSTAVLLPDATVLSAGGGEYKDENNHKPRDQFNYPSGQIFYPPYLFRGPRPEIKKAPSQAAYNTTFRLEVSAEPKIGKVTLIRLSSVTHTNNQNQRINDLKFKYDHEDLVVTAPEGPKVCPPGHYMLFAVSETTTDHAAATPSGGVPSVAKIIQVGSHEPVHAPAGSGGSEAGDDATPATTTSVEDIDEAVTAQATGTPVTVGVISHCLYGLGPCWAGAYAGLRTLSGVAAVRPIANAEDSTAELYLDHEGLPDLDLWPEQFDQATNGSYDLGGVEVTITGAIQERSGALHLNAPSFDVTLKPLEQGVKVQRDPETGNTRPATADELAAYQQAEALHRDGETGFVRVTGPLTKAGTEWLLYVRVVERAGPR